MRIDRFVSFSPHDRFSIQILAVYSPYFRAMLFGSFSESSQDVIKLPDIEYGDFVELLHVIHPPGKRITGKFSTSIPQKNACKCLH